MVEPVFWAVGIPSVYKAQGLGLKAQGAGLEEIFVSRDHRELRVFYRSDEHR